MVEIIIAGALVVLVGILAFGVLTNKMEMRPFRTSGVVLAGILVGALWLTFHYDITDLVEDPYSRGFVDASIVMVVLTGLVTAINRVFDDGGESDTVKVVREFLNKD